MPSELELFTAGIERELRTMARNRVNLRDPNTSSRLLERSTHQLINEVRGHAPVGMVRRTAEEVAAFALAVIAGYEQSERGGWNGEFPYQPTTPTPIHGAFDYAAAERELRERPNPEWVTPQMTAQAWESQYAQINAGPAPVTPPVGGVQAADDPLRMRPILHVRPAAPAAPVSGHSASEVLKEPGARDWMFGCKAAGSAESK